MTKLFEKERMLPLIATLLVAVEIFYLSSLSFGSSSKSTISFSAVYHFVIFFLFNFFLLITIKGKGKFRIKYLAIALVISVIYGVLDELHQTLVPGRCADIGDILTNTAGILTSSGTLLSLLSKNKKF